VIDVVDDLRRAEPTLGLIAFLSVFARPDGPVFPLPSISQ
jgi:hypothetical protein